MPIGQAQTTWFPELKEMLKERWDSNFSIPEQFKLVKELNDKLNQIRKDGNMQPPMMWCPKCQKRERGAFIQVSITAMYYAVDKLNLINGFEFKELMRNWEKYSKIENIDVYGNPRDTK